tara:strand:- start:1456 stop:1668 length:213 start_codon:yes stop_codon:yes gene_type:complete
VEVGDLVWMPDSALMRGEGNGLAIVLQTKPDGINRGTPRIRRVKVLWLTDNAVCWEPMSWLEVINEVSPT